MLVKKSRKTQISISRRRKCSLLQKFSEMAKHGKDTSKRGSKTSTT
jgi:hypothetical protein